MYLYATQARTPGASEKLPESFVVQVARQVPVDGQRVATPPAVRGRGSVSRARDA